LFPENRKSAQIRILLHDSNKKTVKSCSNPQKLAIIKYQSCKKTQARQVGFIAQNRKDPKILNESILMRRKIFTPEIEVFS
jgi:hypothetical protein